MYIFPKIAIIEDMIIEIADIKDMISGKLGEGVEGGGDIFVTEVLVVVVVVVIVWVKVTSMGLELEVACWSESSA